jgi:sigma-B regulation protein RsbU (phosphoserine phosphatase)
MLPVLNDSFPGREEISVAASMEPAKVVGGDFFDLFFIDNDKLVFLIADVAGKGVPGALFMMNAKQILKEKILSSESLAEAVTLANNDLCLRNEAEMFVTSWLGVLDLATGHVDYINAGHNPPVICEGGDAEYLISRSGLVLAGMEGVPYRQNEFEMKQGTMIFLYTDGVTEAENENYDQFGEDALLENINEVRDEDPEKIVEHIRGKLTEHADGCEQSDDITMLCIKYGQSN